MTIDFITVTLLLLGIASRRNSVLAGSIVGGILVTEFFSQFSFGVLSLSFVASLLGARILLFRIDHSSWVGWFIAFGVGLGMHSVLFFVTYLTVFSIFDFSTLLRFSSFLLREIVLAMGVLVTFVLFKNSFYYLRYAVVEEKII
ncbi:MAG: hypothetical protein O2794_01435 [bacterium]|nr:hypothetical protein [bacterium]